MFKSINGGQLPQRATRYSAGFDVFVNEDVVIGAGETKMIGLGICLDEDSSTMDYLKQCGIETYYLELHPRSSLRAKGLGGGVGIIDMDYRDEIKMVITNPMVDFSIEHYKGVNIGSILDVQGGMRITKHEPYTIYKGDKIGQLILKRHEGWLLPAEYTKDDERNGGFGSTNG